MVIPQNSNLAHDSLCKIAQRPSEKPPADAITLDVLKLMELHLQRRNLIPASVGISFRYLWFVAETERNVYLWRNGLSISDADNFEFWVVVKDLIEKRFRQLEKSDQGNPFTNPAWGDSCTNPAATDKEKQYLEMFLEIYQRSATHAHALCQLSKMITKEISGRTREVATIVIPRPAPSNPQL